MQSKFLQKCIVGFAYKLGKNKDISQYLFFSLIIYQVAVLVLFLFLYSGHLLCIFFYLSPQLLLFISNANVVFLCPFLHFAITGCFSWSLFSHHSFPHTLVCIPLIFPHSFFPFPCSFPYSLTLFLFHPLTHSLTHSLTNSLQSDSSLFPSSHQVLKAEEQQRLINNIAGHLSKAQEFIQKRAINNFKQADPAYGKGIEDAIAKLRAGNVSQSKAIFLSFAPHNLYHSFYPLVFFSLVVLLDDFTPILNMLKLMRQIWSR